MKDLGARFCTPINAARPRAARLLESYSPKLGRRIQLFDHAAFAIWIGLDADAGVISFCERPARTGAAANDPLIDFWVRHVTGEEFVMVANRSACSPARIHGIDVRYVADAELAAAGTWISNWQRMLPVINATHALVSPALMRSVKCFVRESMPLARIEEEFAAGDPAIVRGCVFEMLRTAQLSAPTLRVEPLSLHSVIEPTQ